MSIPQVPLTPELTSILSYKMSIMQAGLLNQKDSGTWTASDMIGNNRSPSPPPMDLNDESLKTIPSKQTFDPINNNKDKPKVVDKSRILLLESQLANRKNTIPLSSIHEEEIIHAPEAPGEQNNNSVSNSIELNEFNPKSIDFDDKYIPGPLVSDNDFIPDAPIMDNNFIPDAPVLNNDFIPQAPILNNHFIVDDPVILNSDFIPTAPVLNSDFINYASNLNSNFINYASNNKYNSKSDEQTVLKNNTYEEKTDVQEEQMFKSGNSDYELFQTVKNEESKENNSLTLMNGDIEELHPIGTEFHSMKEIKISHEQDQLTDSYAIKDYQCVMILKDYLKETQKKDLFHENMFHYTPKSSNDQYFPCIPRKCIEQLNKNIYSFINERKSSNDHYNHVLKLFYMARQTACECKDHIKLCIPSEMMLVCLKQCINHPIQTKEEEQNLFTVLRLIGILFELFSVKQIVKRCFDAFFNQDFYTMYRIEEESISSFKDFILKGIQQYSALELGREYPPTYEEYESLMKQKYSSINVYTMFPGLVFKQSCHSKDTVLGLLACIQKYMFEEDTKNEICKRDTVQFCDQFTINLQIRINKDEDKSKTLSNGIFDKVEIFEEYTLFPSAKCLDEISKHAEKCFDIMILEPSRKLEAVLFLKMKFAYHSFLPDYNHFVAKLYLSEYIRMVCYESHYEFKKEEYIEFGCLAYIIIKSFMKCGDEFKYQLYQFMHKSIRDILCSNLRFLESKKLNNEMLKIYGDIKANTQTEVQLWKRLLDLVNKYHCFGMLLFQAKSSLSKEPQWFGINEYGLFKKYKPDSLMKKLKRNQSYDNDEEEHLPSLGWIFCYELNKGILDGIFLIQKPSVPVHTNIIEFATSKKELEFVQTWTSTTRQDPLFNLYISKIKRIMS
jgi:hypothetical protein